MGQITQIIPGNRVLLASGEAQVLPGLLDTAFIDITRGRVAQGVTTNLVNGGIPFLFVDHGVRNSLRYFYAVSAFDVNSVASGPSSLESQRKTKAVTPTPLSPNQQGDVSVTITASGRNGLLTNTTVPTIDPATGKFSGPFPPANGASAGLVASVSQILGAPAELAVQLDSISLGQSGNTGIFGASPTPSAHDLLDDVRSGHAVRRELLVPVTPTSGGSAAGASANDTTGEGFSNDVSPVDPVGRQQVRGPARPRSSSRPRSTSPCPATHVPDRPRSGLHRRRRPRLRRRTATASTTAPAGSTGRRRRPTRPRPIRMPERLGGSGRTDFNNAGALTGVTTINEPHAYTMFRPHLAQHRVDD